MKTTIVDVAKACNVSVATVSRVINGNYPVKEETKEKVQNRYKDISGQCDSGLIRWNPFNDSRQAI